MAVRSLTRCARIGAPLFAPVRARRPWAAPAACNPGACARDPAAEPARHSARSASAARKSAVGRAVNGVADLLHQRQAQAREGHPDSGEQAASTETA